MTTTFDPQDLTVVVPARDTAGTVARTVRSILEQRPGPPRVVVVDDGSTDDTAGRAAAAGAEVLRQAPSGPGAARNRGIAAASTSLVAFCDADDIWPPGRLALDLRTFDTIPELDVLLGRTRFDADEPSLVDGMQLDPRDQAALIPHFGAATVRRSAFDRTGPIDPAMASFEDYDWFLRVREHGLHLVAHERVALWRRMHASSTSQQQPAGPRDLLSTLQRSVARRRDLGDAAALPTLEELVRADVPGDDRPAPLVSVVIPAWNARRHIAEAIRSVLDQTTGDLEVVVVDDGSDDDTADVAWAAADDRCVVVRQPHRGTGATRNAGLALARGTFVAHLDADDLWPPGRLAALVAPLQADPELEATFGTAVEFADPDAPPTAHVETTARPVRAATTGMVRRAAHDRIGGFRTLLTGDQIDWTARAVEAGLRHVTIDAVVLRRRIHATNNSHRFPSSGGTERLALLREMLQRRRASPPPG